jgi:uncharacterized protein (TIGR03067 family)
MRTALCFGLMSALVLVTSPARAQGTGDYVGTYKVISGKRGDKDVPKEHLHSSVRILRDTMTAYDIDHNEVYVLKYNVEKGEPPHRVTMVITKSTRPDAVGTNARGLIKADGDKLTLIYDEKGKEFPKDFTPKDETQHLFIMERTTDTTEKPGK